MPQDLQLDRSLAFENLETSQDEHTFDENFDIPT